ncbi:FecR family protein [Filimonas effusa]|nr:FecR family protein [Filimonas effusa]
MSYSETEIAQLLLKQLSGEITPQEALMLQEWLGLSPANEQLYHKLLQRSRWPSRLLEFEEAARQAEDAKAPELYAKKEKSASGGRLRPLWSLPRRYAAVLFLLLGAAGVIFITLYKKVPDAQLVVSKPQLAPAAQKATLTLADGTIIELDDNPDGTIARQGNASVIKTSDGSIRYEPNGASTGKVMMNTMSTPKGGQYHLTLPDGTKVWLNAASSVTYPAANIAGVRNIKVTGEVYLEVAHDKTRPFIVDVAGEEQVEVLGTQFNVNAYKDYDAIKTTLVDGKVKIINKLKASDAVMLAPGQQSVQGTGRGATQALSVVNADLQQVLAWKNGVFDFNGASFQTVMKEVERWYDIEVKYEGAIPVIRFEGKMDREVKLPGLIRFLNGYGIHATLEGKTLIIENK